MIKFPTIYISGNSYRDLRVYYCLQNMKKRAALDIFKEDSRKGTVLALPFYSKSSKYRILALVCDIHSTLCDSWEYKPGSF